MKRSILLAMLLMLGACTAETSRRLPARFSIDPEMPGVNAELIREAHATWCDATEGDACFAETSYPHGVPWHLVEDWESFSENPSIVAKVDTRPLTNERDVYVNDDHELFAEADGSYTVYLHEIGHYCIHGHYAQSPIMRARVDLVYGEWPGLDEFVIERFREGCEL